ncbi:hypothetical protein CHARACLAT_004054 [Characodon lateralis]|uniref:Uncharacterized protein n=1 Tax=Characodon lateralis TaxID=208331 RepID=A0ABU7DDI0_9TELE|nr:hypothetical protein [Characodon lateralis]
MIVSHVVMVSSENFNLQFLCQIDQIFQRILQQSSAHCKFASFALTVAVVSSMHVYKFTLIRYSHLMHEIDKSDMGQIEIKLKGQKKGLKSLRNIQKYKQLNIIS